MVRLQMVHHKRQGRQGGGDVEKVREGQQEDGAARGLRGVREELQYHHQQRQVHQQLHRFRSVQASQARTYNRRTYNLLVRTSSKKKKSNASLIGNCNTFVYRSTGS